MTDEQTGQVRRLREAGQHAMVFLWAPGVCSPVEFAARRASRVTGFDLGLVEEWLAGVVEVSDDDPLLAGLPSNEVQTIQVTSASSVPGFAEAANWYNPRNKLTMARQYAAYEFTGIGRGLRWTFDTNHSYTDIHCNVRADETDGIGCDLRVEGAARRLGFQFVIKDANWDEFVAPREQIVAGKQYHLDYPLTGFENAPWSRNKPDAMALPLPGGQVRVQRHR